MKRSLLLAAGLVLFAGCATEIPEGRKDAGPLRKAPATIKLEGTRVPKTLSYVGTVVAPRDAIVSSTRGGRVDAYYFEVGQSVRRGDLLVKLGADELSAASRAAAASVSQARARIGTAKDAQSLPSAQAAKSAYELAADAARRAEILFAQGSVSEQELNRTRSNESSARAQYEGAVAAAEAEFGRLVELQATSAQAKAALGDKAVHAPFDGIVLERFVEIGQMAAPNAPLIRVIDPSELRIRFDVPQFDADKVVLGGKITLQAGGSELTGNVVRSTPGLVGEANARLVEAKLALADADAAMRARLLPGARFTVWLELGGEDEVVRIPISATTSTAGLSRAWVIDNNRLSERLLSVLRFEGDRVLVREGLKPGELLVKAPKPDFKLGEEVAP
ncbi:MAG TPA: efflux RND transporter periplasmic adaptor subunit [Polyangiales bacterium]